VRGELDVEDDNPVDPCFNVFDGIQFILSSTVGESESGVQVSNKVGTELGSGDVLE
jgi:hypothetical protein